MLGIIANAHRRREEEENHMYSWERRRLMATSLLTVRFAEVMREKQVLSDEEIEAALDTAVRINRRDLALEEVKGWK